ncbi:hypothetical protein Pcinc_003509 [Petrolisthes cinctipes]|uniref:Secreted protein n=1 Tax=Petrolisthes cinctipes TaxID=88211 RepID=A0AAE1L213_PETCI|nr:hypothetical protein Pcinc_003509 [Petrolisthes cinctipes]
MDLLSPHTATVFLLLGLRRMVGLSRLANNKFPEDFPCSLLAYYYCKQQCTLFTAHPYHWLLRRGGGRTDIMATATTQVVQVAAGNDCAGDPSNIDGRKRRAGSLG